MVRAATYLARVEGEIAALAEIEELAWIDPAQPGDIVLAPLMRVVLSALLAREPNPA
jgi:8-oxo-dGTP diphosphatase